MPKTDPFIPLGDASARVVEKVRPHDDEFTEVYDPLIERIPITSRSQWLGLRLRDITASKVPPICGCDLYGASPAKIWGEMKGLIPPSADNAALKRGRWGEPAVFEALAEERPQWELRRAKVYLRDPQARIGCTPDGVAIDPDRPGIGIIQTKVIMRSVFARDWCGGINEPDAIAVPPLAYQLQTLTESMLAKASWAVLAVLVHDAFDWSLRIIPVERHAGAEAMIRARCAAFWHDYLDPVVCPPINPENDADVVKALYPKERGDAIDLSGNNRLPEILARRCELAAAIKDAEAEKDAIETEIKDIIRESPAARLPGWSISYRTQSRKETIIPAAKFRVLRISDLREKKETQP